MGSWLILLIMTALIVVAAGIYSGLLSASNAHRNAFA